MKYSCIRKLFALQVLFMLALASVSCMREDLLPEDRWRVVEGLPAEVSLRCIPVENSIVTRAAQDEATESKLDNLYIFIFDAEGNKMYGEFFTTISSDKSIRIQTTSANDTRIVGVANVTTKQTASGYSVSESDLDGIQTIGELENLKLGLLAQSISRGSSFMMTGFAEYDSDDKEGHKAGERLIDIPGNENYTLPCTLWLERVDAKVSFNVIADNPNSTPDADGKYWKDFSFQPREWRVCQVPGQSKALRSSTGDYLAGTGDYDSVDAIYFSSGYVPFEEVSRNDGTALFEGGSFVFYMPENRKVPKMAINGGSASEGQSAAYALREKRSVGQAVSDPERPGQSHEQGDFIYANVNSTYVEMTGLLSYKDKEDYLVSANVKLTVHLGYVKPDPNPDDYNTDRNTFYTYNIRVRGIDDIEVEVTEGDKEPRPGYEGDVVYAQNETFYLDAHYDRAHIVIPRKNIKYTAEDGTSREISWGISTPFEVGMYQEGADLKDYKWIKFAINKDYKTPYSNYVKYPGDQNYYDESLPDDRKTNNAPPGDYYRGEGVDRARLLDVKQLVERLKEEYDKGDASGIFELIDGEEAVAVTVFIDENVYVKHPTDASYNGDPLMLWKECVETDDRQLHITSGRMRYSADGASSVIESIYTFRQKSIRTIYDKTKVDKAWGVESRMEAVGNQKDDSGGIRLRVGNVSRETDEDNGRQNTINSLDIINQTLYWDDVLNLEAYSLRDDCQDAVHAVLTRNRDLDGDNIVDPEEIRWYLASINQLTYLYIGEYALDADARLFPENSADRPGGKGLYWHYTTSSYNAGEGAPWVLWAEEGASKGNYYGEEGSNARNGELYSYRCVRNLGIDLDSMDETPEPLITYAKSSDGTYLINATRLNPKSRRSYSPSVLPNHDSNTMNNLLYDNFQVSDAESDMGNNGESPIYENIGWDGLRVVFDFTNNLLWRQCLSQESKLGEYRLPNERELLVMSAVLPDDAWKRYSYTHALQTGHSKTMYMCKTRFARAGEGHFGSVRASFRFDASNKTMGVLNDSDSDSGYMRGVRDVRY